MGMLVGEFINGNRETETERDKRERIDERNYLVCVQRCKHKLFN